jgi:hypothetical protein
MYQTLIDETGRAKIHFKHERTHEAIIWAAIGIFQSCFTDSVSAAAGNWCMSTSHYRITRIDGTVTNGR